MGAYTKMEAIATDLLEGDFTTLRVSDSNCVMTDVSILLQNAGGGGTANLPLPISN